MKIILIDSKEIRRQNIFTSIEKINSLKKSCRDSIYDLEGKIIDDTQQKPELFVLHINDQIKLEQTGEGDYEKIATVDYMKKINTVLPDALMIIYSGGGIEILERSENQLILKQSNLQWDIKTNGTTNFCVISRSVNSATDLNIVSALENYTSGGTKERFFEILQIKGLTFLPALSILCQGYLLAFIDPARKVPRGVDTEETEEVKKAILELGLEKLEGEELKNIYASCIESEEWQAALKNKGYWQAFNDFNLIEEAKKEWGGTSTTLDVHWNNLEKLLTEIKDSKEIKTSVVASSFVSIAERLKQKAVCR